MRHLIHATLLCSTFLFLLNCTANSTNKQDIHREWMLVFFQNFTKDFLTKNKAEINLTRTSGKQFSAQMGCNSMFFTADFKDSGSVKFSGIGSTMIYCNGKMDLETSFAKTLPTMTQYKVEGHFLTLSDGSGHEMKFVAADWD